ncbi:hypothetical protein ACRRTK_024651 [Alexandromys fortis]
MRGIGAEGRGCGRGELGGLRLRADNEADGPCGLGEPSVEARGIRGPVSPGIDWSREGREARLEGFVRLTGTVEKLPRKRKSRNIALGIKPCACSTENPARTSTHPGFPACYKPVSIYSASVGLLLLQKEGCVDFHKPIVETLLSN